MAVTPDGSEVIVPSGAPYYHPVLRTSDLVEVHRYPTVPYPNAVAIRPDGLVVAGTNSSYDKDMWVFEPGGTTPIATYEFGHLPNQETWAHNFVDGGLAVFGNRIYAVTDQLAEPDMVTLRIRTLPDTRHPTPGPSPTGRAIDGRHRLRHRVEEPEAASAKVAASADVHRVRARRRHPSALIRPRPPPLMSGRCCCRLPAE